ncbi:MAG: hypothetical protein ACPF8V_03515 [Luteibaculum sp.]
MMKIKLLRWAFLLSIAAALFFMREEFSLKTGAASDVLANIIFSASIIAGVILAYILAKVFQLGQEKSALQNEFDGLSERLKNYAKLLFRVMKSKSFWTRYEDIILLKEKYGKLSFEDLHSEKTESSSSEGFWKSEENFSAATADLYLAMEQITGEIPDSEELEFNSEKIDQSYLNKILPALNQIWFYLEDRFTKHTAGLINDQGIWEPYQDSIRSLTATIDRRLRRKDFDRTILAEIANNLMMEDIPRMLYILQKKRSILTKSLSSLLLTLSVILLAGLILPLVLQLFNFNESFMAHAIFWSSTVLICGVLNLLFEVGIMIYRDFKNQ